MGYSNYLYEIDIDSLRSSIGSNDRKLTQRALRAKTPRVADEDRVRSANVVRVKVGLDGELFCNGERSTLEDIISAFTTIGEQCVLASYNEPHPKGYWPPGQKRSREAVLEAAAKTGVSRYLGCDSDRELTTCKWNDDDDDGVRLENMAVAELVTGEISRIDCGYAYGYALERLCHVIGKRIRKGDFGNLADLAASSRLCTWRSPVSLPKIDDFPYISFVTHDELRNDIEAFRSVDASGTETTDEVIERKQLLGVLEHALHKQFGIVAFYY
jgi:hypothetical protein